MKEPFHLLPGQWCKQVGHRVLLGVFKPGQGFQKVRQVVTHACLFLLEPFEQLGKAVQLRHGVEIDEIPLRPSACDRGKLRKVAESLRHSCRKAQVFLTG